MALDPDWTPIFILSKPFLFYASCQEAQKMRGKYEKIKEQGYCLCCCARSLGRGTFVTTLRKISFRKLKRVVASLFVRRKWGWGKEKSATSLIPVLALPLGLIDSGPFVLPFIFNCGFCTCCRHIALIGVIKCLALSFSEGGAFMPSKPSHHAKRKWA